MALVFYHGHGSPYSWRVWLSLEHKQIPHEVKVLSFSEGDTKKPEFIAVNPRHQVPAISDDGFNLWESSVIPEYLEDKYPSQNPATSLFPGDAQSRARIRRLTREIDAYLWAEGVSILADELFFKKTGDPDLEKMAAAKQEVARELEFLAKELRGDFFAGATPSAADFALFPAMGYLARMDFRKPGHNLVALMPAAIAAWKKRIEALPYFDKTFPPHWR
jgi:glutathione S-transferase